MSDLEEVKRGALEIEAKLFELQRKKMEAFWKWLMPERGPNVTPRTTKNRRRRNKGFSTLELLIVLSVMMVPILAIMTVSVQIQKQMRAITLSQEFIQFASLAQLTVQQSTSCTTALAGQPFVGPMNNVTFTDPSGRAITAGVEFNGLQFTTVRLDALSLVPGYADQYFANLFFGVEKTGQISGPKTMRRAIPLRVVVSGGIVDSCFSYSDLSLARICDSLSGVFEPLTQKCGSIP